MSTFRRILKYTPAVVMGLLVLAWVHSWIFVVGRHSGAFGCQIYQSSVVFSWGYKLYEPWWEYRRQPIEYPADMLGVSSVQWTTRRTEWEGRVFIDFPRVFVPLPVLLTAILPLAIGPFLSFRFRLWHYLAYTALVAVELAYYLRWQG